MLLIFLQPLYGEEGRRPVHECVKGVYHAAGDSEDSNMRHHGCMFSSMREGFDKHRVVLLKLFETRRGREGA
jgi:hypothetical protein